MHYRRTGIANYVIFTDQVKQFCDEHRYVYARSLNVAEIVDDDALDRLATEVAEAGRIQVVSRENGGPGGAADLRGDVQQPVAQFLRLGKGEKPVQQQVPGPAKQVDTPVKANCNQAWLIANRRDGNPVLLP